MMPAEEDNEDLRNGESIHGKKELHLKAMLFPVIRATGKKQNMERQNCLHWVKNYWDWINGEFNSRQHSNTVHAICGKGSGFIKSFIGKILINYCLIIWDYEWECLSTLIQPSGF